MASIAPRRGLRTPQTQILGHKAPANLVTVTFANLATAPFEISAWNCRSTLLAPSGMRPRLISLRNLIVTLPYLTASLYLHLAQGMCGMTRKACVSVRGGMTTLTAKEMLSMPHSGLPCRPQALLVKKALLPLSVRLRQRRTARSDC